MTTGQWNEAQVLHCMCGTCTGTFTLKFRGKSTTPIATDATTAQLKSALESLTTIRVADVTSIEGAAVNQVFPLSNVICNAAGVDNVIHFSKDPGNLPPLELTNGVTGSSVEISLKHAGEAASYVSSRDGTTESTPCSGRGFCNAAQNGLCVCDAGFGDSDGTAAAPGTVPNCGYYAGAGLERCPQTAESTVPCNGHGACSGTPSYVCTCNSQYTGHDCALRTCLRGPAWFDEAYATGHAVLSLTLSHPRLSPHLFESSLFCRT
jgi:hypothetical protein